jgi:hypothetical protein
MFYFLLSLFSCQLFYESAADNPAWQIHCPSGFTGKIISNIAQTFYRSKKKARLPFSPSLLPAAELFLLGHRRPETPMAGGRPGLQPEHAPILAKASNSGPTIVPMAR